jgi:voltage-gated potassium channel
MKIYVPNIRTFILGRYSSLLLTILCLYIFQPLIDTLGGRFLIEALFIGALIAGLRAINIKRELFRFEVSLVIGSIICAYAGSMLNNTVLFMIGIAGQSIFLTMVAMTLLFDLFKAKKVSADTLAGAVCVYLLIGLIWSYLYLLVEISVPGSFSFTQGDARLQLWIAKEFHPFFYFSLVTVTTVGYGDMAPVSVVARTLATAEGILGQVYLTILVARLVGMHLLHQQEEGD